MKRKFRGDSTGVLMIRWYADREPDITITRSMRAMMRALKKRPCIKYTIVKPISPFTFNIGDMLTGNEGIKK